jgi:SAM-dependent methyltransferase
VKLWTTVPDFEYQTCTNEHFSYYICYECDSLFLLNPPSSRLLEIYPSNYYSFVDEGYSFLHQIKFFLDRRRFRQSFKGLPFSEVNILDVGGGIGHLAVEARRSFLQSTQVKTWVCDLDLNAKTRAESNGHIYVRSTFEDFDVKKLFHVILAFNIIEHVENPNKFLEKIDNLLESGGIAILQTPNWKSLDAWLFRRYYWGGLHAPRHFYLFSKGSLKKEILSRGFKILAHRNVPAGSFWTYSVFALTKGRNRKINVKPMYVWPLHGLLIGAFTLLDLVRGVVFNTSQQYLVLQKL